MSLDRDPDMLGAHAGERAAVPDKHASLFQQRVSETANMRRAMQQPSFAVEPTAYDLGYAEKSPGEKFTQLNLVNHGATATDITAKCTWQDSESGGGGGTQTFYIISLARDGYAGLEIPAEHLERIILQKQFLTIEITCNDAAGNAYSVVITNGLDKIRGTKIKLAYQNNNWKTIYAALNNIYHTLNNKL